MPPSGPSVVRANPPVVTAPQVIPPAIPSFHRLDTLTIKQKLHDALGEAGLPYWKALNAYILGQVGREELTALVRGWLKGENLQLHNDLLKSLLHNAGDGGSSHASSPLMHKRRRGGVDAPDFDSDATFIEPRDRVRQWIMGMAGRERDRVIRSQQEEDGAPTPAPGGAASAEVDWATNGLKRKWSAFQSMGPEFAPLAQSAHLLPSSNQLGARLCETAKEYGLDVEPDQARDVGEFMGVGLQSHIGDILHSVVHLTGRDRPGEDTMRVPLGTKDANVAAPQDHPVPKPNLQTMHYLFTLTPGLQSQVSPTLYKLGSGLTVAEAENARPTPPPRKPSASTFNGLMGPPSIVPNANQADGVATSPKKAAIAIQAAAGQGKIEAVSQTLADTGLLKIDKAGHDHGADGAPKREKKHNLHWKYEDPAIILKDLLG